MKKTRIADGSYEYQKDGMIYRVEPCSDLDTWLLYMLSPEREWVFIGQSKWLDVIEETIKESK